MSTTDTPSAADTKDQAILQGLAQAAQALKETVTTVAVNDVSITITAEPVVLDIHLPPNCDMATLPSTLRQCLNEAFRKSAEQVVQRATAEL